MRPQRIFQAVNSSVISAHLISWALDRKMILDDIAKVKFRELLAQQCAFSHADFACPQSLFGKFRNTGDSAPLWLS